MRRNERDVAHRNLLSKHANGTLGNHDSVTVDRLRDNVSRYKTCSYRDSAGKPSYVGSFVLPQMLLDMFEHELHFLFGFEKQESHF